MSKHLKYSTWKSVWKKREGSIRGKGSHSYGRNLYAGLLVVWRDRLISTWLLQWASPSGGGLAKTMNIDHCWSASAVNFNIILCTDGFANSLPTTYLIDSGAALSVIWFQSLPTRDHGAIIKIDSSPVNTKGVPLDVKGQIKTFSYSGIFHLWAHVYCNPWSNSRLSVGRKFF